MILGIDVGGTWVRFGYVDRNKEIRHEARFPMPEVFGSSVADFADYIENYIHDCGEKPLAVAIGLPSILDKKKRRVLSTANIAMLQDIPLADLLEEKLGIPCFLNHDVKSLLEFDIDLFG
ncbi:MAG: ROK family protein, partial [Christensenellaceae bacterium]|nr:ROK family protein [Christensenellaceae bacterium]